LTAELRDDFIEYRRSLSTGPLLVPRVQTQSWLTRMENKLRGIYETITCTRTSDVAAQRPPRPYTHQQHPRPHVPPPHQSPPHYTHQQSPRPRLTPQATPRPPPPDEAGGSSWREQISYDLWQQQQRPLFQAPMPNFGFRPQPQPHGMYFSYRFGAK
jgi:hypothetical protein